MVNLVVVGVVSIGIPAPVRVSPATLPGTGCHHNWIIVVPKYVAANGLFFEKNNLFMILVFIYYKMQL